MPNGNKARTTRNRDHSTPRPFAWLGLAVLLIVMSGCLLWFQFGGDFGGDIGGRGAGSGVNANAQSESNHSPRRPSRTSNSPSSPHHDAEAERSDEERADAPNLLGEIKGEIPKEAPSGLGDIEEDNETDLALVEAWKTGPHGLAAHLAKVVFRVDPDLVKAQWNLPDYYPPRGVAISSRAVEGGKREIAVDESGGGWFESYPGTFELEFSIQGRRPRTLSYTVKMGDTIDLGLIKFDVGVRIFGKVSSPIVPHSSLGSTVYVLHQLDGHILSLGRVRDNGSYEVTGIPEGAYTVVARSQYYLTSPVTAHSSSAYSEIELNLTASNFGTLEGRIGGRFPGRSNDVFLSNGAVIVRAIHVDDPAAMPYLTGDHAEATKSWRGGMHIHQTGRTFKVQLPTGRYLLVMNSRYLFKHWEATVTAGEVTRLDLELPKLGGLQGKLTYEDGTPVSSTRIALAVVDQHNSIHPLSSSESHVTNADGEYSIPEAFPGKYVLRVIGHSATQVGDVLARSRVTIKSEQTATLDIVLPKSNRTTVTIEAMMDGVSAKIRSYEWRRASDEKSRWPSEFKSKVQPANKQPLVISNVPLVDVIITLELFEGNGIHPIFFTFLMPVSEDPEVNFRRIHLTKGSLKGSLVDTVPRSINAECTIVLRQPGFSTPVAIATVHPIGDYSFPELPDGRYEVEVKAPWGVLWSGTVMVNGDTTLPITLPK